MAVGTIKGCQTQTLFTLYDTGCAKFHDKLKYCIIILKFNFAAIFLSIPSSFLALYNYSIKLEAI